MDIRCIHCRYRFSLEAVGLLQELTGAVCPSCGRETPMEEMDSAEASEESAEEVETPDPPAPEPAEEESDDWMILKENGKVYGPFTMDVVVGWIEDRKINAAEEVSPDGIEWWSFGEHEAFAHLFAARLGGVVVPEGGISDVHFRRKTPFRDFFKGLAKVLAFLCFSAGIAAGVWYSAHDNDSFLVVPEAMVNEWLAKAKQLTKQEEAPLLVSAPRPGELLLQELAAQYDGEEGSTWELLMRGRHLMLQDTNASLRAARPKLETAVVLDPNNGLALAALAELYNILAARHLAERDLQRKSIYLLERAQESNSWQAEVLRARATFLIYSDNPEEVEAVAREAVALNPRDPQLHFLLALAAKGKKKQLNEKARGHFDDALKLDPGFHGVWHELGRSAEHAGKLGMAIEHYEKKISLAPGSPATLLRLGLIHEALGEPQRAARFYDTAITIDPSEESAVMRRAVLAYQVDGEPEAAAAMLEKLQKSEDVSLDIGQQKDLWCHLSAAQRLAGDSDAAIATADLALSEDAHYAPALFHKALALVAAGRPQESLPLFSAADSSGLDNWNRAVILFQEGRAAHAADQLQDAVDAYERAIDAYPSFMPAYMWRVAVRLDLGDPALGSAEFLRHLGIDPLDYARPRVAGLYYDPLPSLEPLALRMLALAEEQSYAPQLQTSAGVLLFHDGRFDQASRVFLKALSQRDRGETARFYSALIAYKKGSFRFARAQFVDLLEINRSKGIFHVYDADNLFALGLLEPAASGFRESFGLGIRSSWVHGRLAEVLVAAGDAEAGAREIERGLQLKTSCSLAASRLRAGY